MRKERRMKRQFHELMLRRFLVAFLLATVAAPTCLAQPASVVQDSAATKKILGLFDTLRKAQEKKAQGSPIPVSFQLSDAEVNEYSRYALKATPRPGLESVNVKIFAHNYLSTFTVVDFSAVERWKPGTIPGILRPVLNGKKSIWVDYRFETKSSALTFTVVKAYYQNLRIPAFVVERLIGIVAARQPERYDTSKPLPLPFGLRQISTSDHLLMGTN
jgi:hypothetical protein